MLWLRTHNRSLLVRNVGCRCRCRSRSGGFESAFRGYNWSVWVEACSSWSWCACCSSACGWWLFRGGCSRCGFGCECRMKTGFGSVSGWLIVTGRVILFVRRVLSCVVELLAWNRWWFDAQSSWDVWVVGRWECSRSLRCRWLSKWWFWRAGWFIYELKLWLQRIIDMSINYKCLCMFTLFESVL